jgi:hypothetical protein
LLVPLLCSLTCVALAAALAAAAGRVISIEHDLIPALVPLLSARSSGVQEMAAFALARLAQLNTYQAAILQVGRQFGPELGWEYGVGFWGEDSGGRRRGGGNLSWVTELANNLRECM